MESVPICRKVSDLLQSILGLVFMNYFDMYNILFICVVYNPTLSLSVHHHFYLLQRGRLKD